MEEHLKRRPPKTPFSEEKIRSLRAEAIQKIKSTFLPDEKIIKILLIGSSIKNTFGKYEPPGFRGSLFSDFDFLFFVEDAFEIPDWLTRERDGRPFPEQFSDANLAFRQKNFVQNQYDAEIFFIRKSTWKNPEIQALGERKNTGIPMTPDSQHKHWIIYSREDQIR